MSTEMREETAMRLFQVEASLQGFTLFRNTAGRVQTEDGRFITFGLGPKGSSDLIGWFWLEVEERGGFNFAFGARIAVIVAIECKMKGNKPTEEQRHFLDVVHEQGGYSAVVTFESDNMDDLKGEARELAVGVREQCLARYGWLASRSTTQQTVGRSSRSTTSGPTEPVPVEPEASASHPASTPEPSTASTTPPTTRRRSRRGGRNGPTRTSD